MWVQGCSSLKCQVGELKLGHVKISQNVQVESSLLNLPQQKEREWALAYGSQLKDARDKFKNMVIP